MSRKRVVNFRVEQDEWEAFLALAETMHRTPSQVLRGLVSGLIRAPHIAATSTAGAGSHVTVTEYWTVSAEQRDENPGHPGDTR